MDKIFWLDETVTEYPQKNVVFLARCTLKNAYAIAGTCPSTEWDVK